MKATISAKCDRWQTWMDVFGTDTIEVVSPIPHKRQGPDGPRDFYQIDVKALTLRQRANMLRHLSARWKTPADQVAKLVDDPDHGVPIDAQDVIVAMDIRLFI